MSSHRVDAGVEPHAGAGNLHRLLDPIFGYFVWAAHLLVVYIAAAIACQLGLGAASAATHATFTTVLALITVGAAAIVVLHALRRYRQNRSRQTSVSWSGSRSAMTPSRRSGSCGRCTRS